MHKLQSVAQRKYISSNRTLGESQRRNPRRVVRPGAMVIFKKTARFRFIGKPRILHTADLIDISMEGLRARYTANDKWSSPFDHISIAAPDNALIVDDIYCKIISDFQVTYTAEGERSRVCGVKFSELTRDQASCLKRFIREYTVAENKASKWHVQFD